MRELGEAGRAGDGLKNLAAEVKDEHEDERERWVPVRMPANDASTMSMNTTPEAPMSALFGKKNQSTSPVTSCRGARGEQNALAAEALLRRWADDEQHDDVAAVGGEIRVAEHVQEKARVGQPVRQRRAVDAKEVLRRPAVGELAETEREQAQQCEP